MKKPKPNKKDKVNDFRKSVNDIKKELMSPMTAERMALLIGVRDKLELWARMEEGDVDALMELAIEHGISSRKSWEQSKKEAKACE